jgi:hypothetical protein
MKSMVTPLEKVIAEVAEVIAEVAGGTGILAHS